MIEIKLDVCTTLSEINMKSKEFMMGSIRDVKAGVREMP